MQISLDRARQLARRQLRRAARSEDPRVQRGYQIARDVSRSVVNTLTSSQMGWMANLRSARWTEAGFEISGWAYLRGHGFATRPKIQVWLDGPGDRKIRAKVTRKRDIDANALARSATFDYANTGFRAVIPVDQLLAAGSDPSLAEQPWVVRVRVSGPDHSFTGTFKYRNRFASPRYLGVATFADDIQVLPVWRRGSGLVFYVRQAPIMATDVSVDGRHLRVIARDHRVRPVSAAVLTPSGEPGAPAVAHPLPLTPLGAEQYLIEGSIPDLVRRADFGDGDEEAVGANQTTSRRVVVYDADGTAHAVRTRLDQASPQTRPGATMFAYSSGGGRLTVRDAPGMLIVDSVEVVTEHPRGPRLLLTGRVVGSLARPRLLVVGARQSVDVDLEVRPDQTFAATVPLLASQWDGPRLPLMTGGYSLRGVDGAGDRFRVACVDSVIARTPETHAFDTFRLRLQVGGGRRLRMRIGPPRRRDELGSFHQARLLQEYRETDHAPQNAVYFESFYGRKATCNPWALDREIARRYPQLIRFWGVVDGSVPVPPGAVAVIAGTREWWAARASARYVIINDWSRAKFQRQPFQIVLQTWHGSMLKRLGLDRPAVPPSTRTALEREKGKWDVLLSQNRHSSDIFATSYEWDGLLFEEGYPRNDPMSQLTGAAVRARLGIGPTQKAILYCPTWRDNQTEMVTFLDLPALRRELGEDYVFLLRGHSRTLAYGQAQDADGVIDVTTYPEVTDLFLAADALITDYSSVMFDYSVTGRPMLFFVPDMDDYRDSIRGVYFDLAEEAPGPVLDDQTGVAEAIRRMELDAGRYAARYAAWRHRFNAYDDGHSAERVVRRLFALRAPDLPRNQSPATPDA